MFKEFVLNGSIQACMYVCMYIRMLVCALSTVSIKSCKNSEKKNSIVYVCTDLRTYSTYVHYRTMNVHGYRQPCLQQHYFNDSLFTTYLLDIDVFTYTVVILGGTEHWL